MYNNYYRLEKILKGEMFSATELSEIGTFMDLAMREANAQTEVCVTEDGNLQQFVLQA